MKNKIVLMVIAIIILIILMGTVVIGIVGNFKGVKDNPIATITIEGDETPIVVELYPQIAPNTVNNFITLANNGFYNGLIIHRVEKNFVIQMGDPQGTGNGGPTLSAIDSSIEKGSDADKEYTIVGEFTKNGYKKNTLKHERGVISMARSSYSGEVIREGYNSAGSQFFICQKDAPSLNGLYAGFGRVISGMETVDKISEVELHVDKNEETGEETKTSKPEKDIVISSITVDTKGLEYNKPETQEPFDYTSWYMKKYYGI